jgi:hypothetical protein
MKTDHVGRWKRLWLRLKAWDWEELRFDPTDAGGADSSSILESLLSVDIAGRLCAAERNGEPIVLLQKEVDIKPAWLGYETQDIRFITISPEDYARHRVFTARPVDQPMPIDIPDYQKIAALPCGAVLNERLWSLPRETGSGRSVERLRVAKYWINTCGRDDCRCRRIRTLDEMRAAFHQVRWLDVVSNARSVFPEDPQ